MAAQLAAGARGARGISFAVLGAAFVLRAVGDSAGPSGPSWLTWTSPLGWVELTRPFDGPRWWVLALPCAVLAAGVGVGLRPVRAARSRRRAAAGPARPAGRLRPAARAAEPGLPAAAGRARRLGGRNGGPLRRLRRGRPGDRLAARQQHPAQERVHQARRSGRHHQRLPGRAHAAGRPGRRGLRHLGGAPAARGGDRRPGRAAARHGGRPDQVGAVPPGRGGLRHRGPAGPGRPGHRPGLRAARRVRGPAGGADARRGHGPAARVPGAGRESRSRWSGCCPAPAWPGRGPRSAWWS